MLPAYAGMILTEEIAIARREGAPRVCGDDPSALPVRVETTGCSPRMRG